MTDGHSIEEAALRYVDRANQGRLREAIDGFRELIVEAEREDDEANLALLWDCLGDSLARARDFDGAVESYRESIALDRDPVGFAQSYRGLGIVYHLAGDVVRARDSFDEALAALRQTEQPEADHERVVLFCGIGSMYEHHADFTKAIDAYEKARAIAEKGGNERDLALCSRHLGSVHKEQGDLDAAENYLRQAADLLDDIGDSASMERITLHNLLGAVTEDRGDVASAIESYRAAMDLADRIDFPPGRMESLRRLGSAEAARGQFQRASESYSAAITLARQLDDKPSLSELYLEVGFLRVRSGRFDEAIDAFKQSLALDQAHRDPVGIAKSYRGLGMAYQEQGGLDRAVEAFEEAEVHLRRGEDQLELAILTTCQGSLFEERGKYKQAHELYEKALTINERMGNGVGIAICHRHLGSLAREEGRLEAALEHIDKALELRQDFGFQDRPELIKLLNEKGAALEDKGMAEEALSQYRHSLKLADEIAHDSARAATLRRIGSAYANRGDYRDSLEAYSAAIELTRRANDEPALSELWDQMGDLYLQTARIDDAIESYKESLSLDQTHRDPIGIARSHRGLGAAHQLRGEFSRADEAFDEAESHLRQVDDEVETAILLTQRGTLYLALGQCRKADEFFERAIAINDSLRNQVGLAVCRRHLSHLRILTGDLLGAGHHLAAAMEIQQTLGFQDKSEHVELLLLKGAIDESEGRPQEAMSSYSEALSLATAIDHAPARGRCLRATASIHLHHGEYKAAAELLDQSLVIDDEHEDTIGRVHTLLGLGEACAGQGEADEAIEILGRAARIAAKLEVSPLIAEVGIQLGEAYVRSGDLRRAEEQLDEAAIVMESVEIPYIRAAHSLALGLLREHQGQLSSALDRDEQPLRDGDGSGNLAMMIKAHSQLAGAHLKLGDFTQAQEHVRDANRLRLGDEYEPPWDLHVEDLHPSLGSECIASFRAGSYAASVVSAFTVCEDRLRALSGNSSAVMSQIVADVLAEDLSVRWLSGEREIVGLRRFIVGAFAIFRNPLSHRPEELTSTEAFAALCAAHTIHTLLDSLEGSSA